MALTDAEKQELLNEIKASSNDVSELETVTSLDGIVSLPAMRGEELVNAPIALLRKPAEEAAQELIKPHRNVARLQQDFIRAWKSKKVKVSFTKK